MSADKSQTDTEMENKIDCHNHHDALCEKPLPFPSALDLLYLFFQNIFYRLLFYLLHMYYPAYSPPAAALSLLLSI